MISDNSRIAVIKVSNIPETSPLDDKGITILNILFIQPIPWTLAVSSIDLSIWSIAEIPVLEVKGRFFTTVIKTKIVNVP